MSTDQRRLAARALMAKVLADDVAKEVKRTRDALEPTLLPGEKVNAVLPDGRIVGKVQLTEAPVSVVVTDEAELLAYVRRARPDQIVTTETIRPAFLTWLLGDAKRQLTDPDTAGLVVDSNGEIVPGLELSYGTPSYRPDVPAPGRKVLREVLAELLDLPAVLALEQEP